MCQTLFEGFRWRGTKQKNGKAITHTHLKMCYKDVEVCASPYTDTLGYTHGGKVLEQLEG